MTRGVCTDEAKGVKRVQSSVAPTSLPTGPMEYSYKPGSGDRTCWRGSLGERDLDYCWKRTRAAQGTVKYSDVASSVAGTM